MSTPENMLWAGVLVIIGAFMLMGGMWEGYVLLAAGPTLFVLIERAK